MRWLAVAAIVLVAAACTSSGGNGEKTGHDWFQARPLIMPGLRTTTVHADPFGSLRVPTSEYTYYSLTPAQKADLAAALRAVDCAHPPHLTGSPDRIVCDTDSDAYLLGAPLFTGNDVTDAKPLEPSGGVVGWQVSMSLTSAASQSMHRWTSRHHVASEVGEFNDVQTSPRPPCSLDMITQCADFVAFLDRNMVVTIPVWSAPVTKMVVINGVFSERYATRLAGALAS
jgi:hypothetical protein